MIDLQKKLPPKPPKKEEKSSPAPTKPASRKRTGGSTKVGGSSNPVPAPEQAGETFLLGGGKLSFAAERLRYLELMAAFRLLKRECAKTVEKDYRRTLDESPRMLVYRFSTPYAKRCAKRAAEIFKSWGCSRIGERELLGKLDVKSYFKKSEAAWEDFRKSAENLTPAQEEKYRKWAADAARRGVDVDSPQAMDELIEVLGLDNLWTSWGERKDIREQICRELLDFVGEFHLVACATVNRLAPQLQCEVPGVKQAWAVQKLVDNYGQGQMPLQDRAKTCLKILAARPYWSQAYAWAFEEFGDEKGGLAAMAARFGVEGIGFLQEEAVLREFGQGADITTREALKGARERVKCAKLRAGLPEKWTFNPLVRAGRDLSFRERVVAGRVFDTRKEAMGQMEVYREYQSSGFLESAEACTAGMAAVRAKAAAAGVDASWLLDDMETALRRHGENARVRFGYLFDTEEEWTAAERSEELFFRAVWARIKGWAATVGGAKFRGTLSEGAFGNVRDAMGSDAENLFLLVNTGGLAVGRTGLAITGDGLAVSNGSAMAGALADNAIVKKFLFGKARQFLEGRRPKGASVRWAELLGESRPVVAVGGKVELAPGVVFEGSEEQARAVAGLVNQLKEWAAELSVPVGGGAKAVPDPEKVRMDNPFTPWPELRVGCDTDVLRLAHAIQWRKKELGGDSGVTLPPAGDTAASFTWGKAGGTKKPERPILCSVSGSSFWTKQCAALAADALLVRDGDSETDVALDAIVKVEENGDGMRVTTRTTAIDMEMGVDGGFRRMVMNCPVSGKGWLVRVLNDYLGTADSTPSNLTELSNAAQK